MRNVKCSRRDEKEKRTRHVAMHLTHVQAQKKLPDFKLCIGRSSAQAKLAQGMGGRAVVSHARCRPGNITNTFAQSSHILLYYKLNRRRIILHHSCMEFGHHGVAKCSHWLSRGLAAIQVSCPALWGSFFTIGVRAFFFFVAEAC